MFDTNIPATTPEALTTDITTADIVVVDFWAPWCAPCKMIAPQIAKLAEKYPNVKFFGLNAEEFRDDIKAMGISTVPTVRVYQGGQQTNQFQSPAAGMQLAALLGTLQTA